MAPSVSMNIPYEPPPAPKQTTLQDDVQRLVKQKGSFHTVSEESLLIDLNKPATTDEVAEGEDHDAVDETGQLTRERLFKVREEIYQGIANVQQQLLTLIDTLSSAVASHSKIGQNAVSPALRQIAPIGSVQTKQVEPKKSLSKPTTQRLNDISTVSRAQSFNAASEKLATASRRLESEAQHQARYWEQMAILRTHGWPISRLPGNDRALVVHFSSAESSPQYRNTGISVLRQDESGDLLVPGQLNIRQQKTLSVIVHRKGQVAGHYDYEHEPNAQNLRIEQDLMRARNSLFHQELFEEASKEARILANMGVKARSSSIEIDVAPECSVALTYSSLSPSGASVPLADQDLAAFIGNTIRLMLVGEHQQKHAQRSEQKPPPMTTNPRPSVEYALLRPLIAHLRHRTTVTPLLDMLNNYQETLALAGVSEFSFSEKVSYSVSDHLSLDALKRPISSEVIINLPSQKALVVKIETYLAGPLFGSQFSPTIYDSACGSASSAQSHSPNDVVNFLEDVIVKELGCLLMVTDPGKSTLVLKKTFPLTLLVNKRDEARAFLTISCKDGKICLQCTKRKDLSVLKAQWSREAFSYLPKAGRSEAGSTLESVVKSWILEL